METYKIKYLLEMAEEYLNAKEDERTYLVLIKGKRDYFRMSKKEERTYSVLETKTDTYAHALALACGMTNTNMDAVIALKKALRRREREYGFVVHLPWSRWELEPYEKLLTA